MDGCTVITCVYVPDNSIFEYVAKNIEATAAEFPNDRRIIAVDAATDEILDVAKKCGCEIIFDEGEPPRMGSLLYKAVTFANTDIIWTVEHDTIVPKGCRDAFPLWFAKFSNLAAVEAISVTPNGVQCTPCEPGIKYHEIEGEPDLFDYVDPGVSLNCVCWRTAALKSINWSHVPLYPACDRMIHRQIRTLGWRQCLTTKFKTVHYDCGARRFLDSEWKGRGESRVISPQVDILITTIGRQSLDQAILAALSQTYPKCRVVVLADGNCPDAKDIFDRVVTIRSGNAIYCETPCHLGSGGALFDWWVRSGRASEWIRPLDDDDWLPPQAISEMAKSIDNDNIAVILCKAVLLFASRENNVCMKWRVVNGNLGTDQCGTCTMMVKTENASCVLHDRTPVEDQKFIHAVSKNGVVKEVSYPLYWYSAYRSNRILRS